MELERSRSAEAFGFRQNVINAKANTGLQSRLDTMLDLDRAREDFIKEEEVRISKAEAALTGDATDAQKNKVEKAREELLLLRAEGGKLQNFIQSSLTGTLANSFEGFITGSKSAKDAMADFATGILLQVARIAAQQLAVQLVGLALGDSNTNQTSGFVGAIAGAISKQAKGGVNTGMSEASGTILNSATYFPNAKVTPLASGGVVAGEAGAEAVLPLKRLSSGRLGVEADLSNGSGSGILIQQLTVNVEQTEDQTSEEQAKAIGESIREQLKTLVQSEIVSSKRSGGSLNPTQLQATF